MADPITNTMNGDSIKITSHNKPYEKRTQNVNMQAKPSSIHPTVDVTSTVIVNNSKIEPPVIHNEENSTAMNNNYNGKNFDFKIEHYVTTSKEEFQGVRTSEKNEIPYNVNIKSSIEVKQNGNDNKDNAQQDEAAASNVSAPVAAPATNKPEVTITETEVVPKKEVKEEQPTPQAAATPVVVEKVIEVVNNEAPPQNIPAPAPAPENKSWASLLKRPNLSEAHEVTSKPTAFIVPNVIANTASADKNEQPHNEKIPPPHSAGPKIHQSKSSLEDAHRGDAPTKQKKQTEIPQRYCDDPITYRMGGELYSNYIILYFKTIFSSCKVVTKNFIFRILTRLSNGQTDGQPVAPRFDKSQQLLLHKQYTASPACLPSLLQFTQGDAALEKPIQALSESAHRQYVSVIYSYLVSISKFVFIYHYFFVQD